MMTAHFAVCSMRFSALLVAAVVCVTLHLLLDSADGEAASAVDVVVVCIVE